MKQIPEIRYDNGIATLYVKGTPYFAFAGEVHNSSAESLEYMEQNVWPKIEDLHMNTLIVPIYWDRVEPKKDHFCFELLDGILEQARERGMHLILLWFGLWKNAESMYVPEWMKKDPQTYFRAETVHGEKLPVISPFCREAIERDANAFARLMAHLREKDEEESTVIMMQVENEVGLLGTPADYSAQGREAFRQTVPEDLLELSGAETNGTWKEVFGEDAEEIFMAYHFARAVEYITESGRREYPLPCFANTWLKQYPWYPGSYPSGGPARQMHQVWKKAAPSLTTLAPDIYVPDVAEVMEQWEYEENPLLIPEARRDAVTASYALHAFTEHNAICYAPFGIEDLGTAPEALQAPPAEMMAALNIDPASFDIRGTKDALGKVYAALEQMLPLYLNYRGTKQMKSFLKKTETDRGCYLKFKSFDLEISYFPKAEGCPIASGVIFELTDTEFLMIGMMCQMKFHVKPGGKYGIEYILLENGSLKEGRFVPCQRMNGDEKGMLVMANQPVCYHVILNKF